MQDVDRLLRRVKAESGQYPQLVVVAASLWPGGGTVWSKRVRRSSLRKLLAGMQRLVSGGLHSQPGRLTERVVRIDASSDRHEALRQLLQGDFKPTEHIMVGPCPCSVQQQDQHQHQPQKQRLSYVHDKNRRWNGWIVG